MSLPMVIADFGPRGAALVDADDYEALKGHRYRMDCHGLVIRSRNRWPGDKGSVSLARDVGDLMGLPADRLVELRGNPLDCTRANLVPGKRLGRNRLAPRAQRSQPPGVHRVKARAARQRGFSSAPPDGYVLYRHDGPCVPRYPGEAARACAIAGTGTYLGTAARVIARTASGRPKPGGWEMRSAAGIKRPFANYFDGVEWLNSLRPAERAA